MTSEPEDCGLSDEEIDLLLAFGNGEIDLGDMAPHAPKSQQATNGSYVPDYISGLIRAQMQIMSSNQGILRELLARWLSTDVNDEQLREETTLAIYGEKKCQ